MRYYFAGSYVRRRELRRLADAVEGAATGAKVVSSWLDGSQADDDNDAGFSDFSDPAVVALAWKYGQRDLADLGTADAIVSFTGEGGRGGRHIEHGVAISRHDQHPVSFLSNPPMRLVVVGPREHVFHCHPATEHFASWTAFLAHEIKQYREESK